MNPNKNTTGTNSNSSGRVGHKPATNNRPSDKLFLFDRTNYYIMFAGLALILLGFILMAGGKSTDPHVFNKEEIYSFRRITLAPILIIAGFIVEAVAIMRKPKGVDPS